MNINLSPAFENYIRLQLDTGTYNNASEVVREALRLKMQQDEIYQTKLEALRSAIVEAEKSGIAEPFDMKEIIADTKTDL
jgi:antitoxin ParD1/3/4